MKVVLDFLRHYTPFIAELLARLFSKKPLFFKYLQLVAAGVAVIAFGLTQFEQAGYALPASLAWLADTTAIVSGIVAAVIAQLPVPNAEEPKKD